MNYSYFFKAVAITFFALSMSSNVLAIPTYCTADTSPSVSCGNLSITGNNLSINVANGIILNGGDAIAVNAGSTGLDLTVQSGATVGFQSVYGLRNYGGSINSITNLGLFPLGQGDPGGISNDGTIRTLNNLQGSSVALPYMGTLPTNYNIIVYSSSDFGKLLASNVSGITNFGISSLSAGSSIVSGTAYASILSGITNTQLGLATGVYSKTGTSNGYSYTLNENGSDIWDLIISSYYSGPGLNDTQASLHNSAQKLRTTFNASAISTNFANMNTYDCNLFDTKGMCISAGGRYTTVDNPNSNSTSAVVVVGYKATPNIRIGGFLDQNVSNNTPTGIKISNKNPLMGVFAVWNQNADGLGYQVKVANAYQDKDVNTTRDVIGTSEAGTGATNLNTQSYVGELSYAFLANQDKTTLRPYLALRQTTIKQDAYTETGVANPLSYGSLKDRSTTALVGLKLNHALTPKAMLTASLGIEQDLEHSIDQYSATSSSIANLTSENFNDSIKRTRPVASAGAYYAVSKTQRISGDVYYQQLPFQSTGSTTAYFSYMIGL